ncbi:hypothetical protein AVEN_54411-1 [Araneus ventricosus]|uniref:Uncharacterized protein n=1 Tax=Araneus ventricosus TaxID=182803 RepID=A0A4Y2D9C6_ARAVE|nr:hypothetical protein AVEN_54411-1 [Araneus ventricosus]
MMTKYAEILNIILSLHVAIVVAFYGPDYPPVIPVPYHVGHRHTSNVVHVPVYHDRLIIVNKPENHHHHHHRPQGQKSRIRQGHQLKDGHIFWHPEWQLRNLPYLHSSSTKHLLHDKHGFSLPGIPISPPVAIETIWL